MPALNTSSLPDLIFTILFFFMIVTTMREVTLMVEFKVPKGTEIEKMTKLAGLGLPVKTKLAAMAGANPQESFGMDFLERQLLKLGTERWINPLVSSNTQSNVNNEGGRPTAEETGEGLTDEGEATRDGNKNDN